MFKYKYVLFPLLVVLLICFGFWLYGFNFDHRGPEAVNCLVLSSWGALVAIFVAKLSDYL